MIEQEGRTYDEYVQEFKKVTRENSYKGKPLIKEFKKGLNGNIRRKLVEAEEPLTTIGEWQERVVRLNRNQKQSRIEERMLERNTVHLGGNVQSREDYRGGSYRGKEGQIIQKTKGPSIGGGYRREGERNTFNRGGTQMGPRRDLNAIDVNREREEDRTCYICGRWGYMAKNCWERYKERVVETLQKLAKESREQ